MICHTIKTEIAYGKFWKRRTIISSFCFGCWTYKNLMSQFFRWSDFSSFSQLLLNFQNFLAYGSAFPAATAATAAAFPAFWRRPSCVATGAAAQVGMASPWDYARLVNSVRNGKIWKPWHLLDELPNSGRIVKF